MREFCLGISLGVGLDLDFILKLVIPCGGLMFFILARTLLLDFRLLRVFFGLLAGLDFSYD